MASAQLKAEVLNLPEQERAEIALALLESLGDEGLELPDGEEWDRIWGEEAAARDEELVRGEVADVAAEAAFEQARRAIERKRGR